ncbi:exonuclease domain-containing protein [Saccharothrix longispora]|uniref:exonuclease domain-containing protein n=1 Tax=Saccharothrix longispora TaxID=33920 RepID=UPI0028FD6533|nr:exonuclease domain-containing protein [Saccharothrix longispora]MDU0288027.1 exonuclease domain-containing protein [Saccharothrix longispora]
MGGYAVLDVETTGLHPGHRHRVVEVAVVRLDARGGVVDEWCTLVNPDRDLGPQHLHGIRAADVRRAPAFADIAGELAARLAGRVLVAHNFSFDARFLQAEYAGLGIELPFSDMPALCTMRLADGFLDAAARSLAACCEAAGVPLRRAHSALDDARAAAGLMACYLHLGGTPEPWRDTVHHAAAWPWPDLPAAVVREVRRGPRPQEDEGHFLARLVGLLPRVVQPVQADDYLDVLDRALLDRHVSAAEQEELLDTARGLGLGLPEVMALHRGYLDALAGAAWADGLVSDEEAADLKLVATMLGLGGEDVAASFERGRAARPDARFRLEPGHCVVFTGEMGQPRAVWEERARAAGLVVGGGVTKKTRLLVAADPDSLSGKAKKARANGVPIVGEETFGVLLAALG